MTVAELIEALKAMPQDAAVVVPMDDGIHFVEPSRVLVIRGVTPAPNYPDAPDADFFETSIGDETRVAIDLGEADPV